MTSRATRELGRALGLRRQSELQLLDQALTEVARFTAQSAAIQVLGSVAWANITSKPSTFAPSAHTHAAESILGAGLDNYANDATAAAGGVVVGGLYRNGSAVQVRVS